MPETSTQITVTKTADGEFQVDVRDTEGETHHAVRADEATIEKFGHGQPAETVVETSFRFLLEREPKVSDELMSMENVVLLPHLGSATIETRIAMGMRVIENVKAFFADETPRDKLV